MIAVRNFTMRDFEAIRQLHEKSGLPSNCLPNLENQLFFLRKVVDDNGKVALGGFLKMTAEAFVLVDHEHESPEWRWAALQKLTAATLAEATLKGIQDVTAWPPPVLENSFGPRLEALGFTRSPWPSYSVRLG